MNVIFLDVDGVLNSQTTEERCNGVIGIDDDKVARLAAIVDKNDATLILTSSWRYHWWKKENEDDEQHPLGEYLDKKLARYCIKIVDKISYGGFNRGKAIRNWLKEHPEVSAFIVLDDEEFDYRDDDVWLIPYLVKTSFYSDTGGLQETHVVVANHIFKKQLSKKQVD